MILRHNTLSYWKSESDAVRGDTPQGSIELDGASVSCLLDNNEFSSSHSLHNKFLFGITPTLSSRMYVIQASSDASRDEWVAACASNGAFHISLTPASSRTQSESLLEGWMDKLKSSMFSSSPAVDRMYFILFVDKIAYWRTNQNTSALPLDRCLLFHDSLLYEGKPSPTSVSAFEICSRKGEPRWMVQCDTHAQKDLWLDALRKTMAGVPFDYPPYSAAASEAASAEAGRSKMFQVRPISTSPPMSPMPHNHSAGLSGGRQRAASASAASPSFSSSAASSSSSGRAAPAPLNLHHYAASASSPLNVNPSPASSVSASASPAAAAARGSIKLRGATALALAAAARSPKQGGLGSISDEDDEADAPRAAGDDDSEEDLPPPPGGDDATLSSDNNDVLEAPVVPTYDLPPPPVEEEEEMEDDETPPPPPPPIVASRSMPKVDSAGLGAGAGSGTGAEPAVVVAEPAHPSSSSSSLDQAESLLHSRPDVHQQLQALLRSRFGGDAQAMSSFLDSFVKSTTASVTATALAAPAAAASSLSPLPPGGLRLLHIHLLEARDLPAMDSNGFSDPYCVLHVRSASGKDVGSKLKSRTVLETLNPVFDQQITLDLGPAHTELVVDVFDYDKYSTDDFCGRVVIDLREIIQGAAQCMQAAVGGGQSTSPTAAAAAGSSTHAGSGLSLSGRSLTGWFPLCSVKESWLTVGSLFLTLIVEDTHVPESQRNSKAAAGNAGFVFARSQMLLSAEAKYFANQHHQYQLQLHAAAKQRAAAAAAASASAASSTALSVSSPTVARVPIGGSSLRLWISSWNVGNAPPPDDLSPWIPLYDCDIYVIGTQECNYAPRRDAASAKVDWQCCLVRHFGREYTLLKLQSLWEIRCAVFVKNEFLPRITHVAAAHEATGIGNVLGNKGGVLVSFCYAGSIKFAFLNAHLAAHQGATELRNQNYRSIVKNIKTGAAGTNDIMNEFHHLFWMGDLNYRLDFSGGGGGGGGGNGGVVMTEGSNGGAMTSGANGSSTVSGSNTGGGAGGDAQSQVQAKSPSSQLFTDMLDRIASGPVGLRDLFKTDQLTREMRMGRAFVGFTEGELVGGFEPTFKVRRAAGVEYNPQRSPAWCDRILWRSVPGWGVRQVALGAILRGVDTSDHKPVASVFEVEVPPIPAPLDRSLGEAVVRLHDLRCTLLRTPRSIDTAGVTPDPNLLALAKDLDPFLVFGGSFLPKPVQTPVARKSVSPQWLELPPAPLSCNALGRLKHSLLYVRVANHAKDDAIIGRAIISLRDLHPEGFENEEEAEAAAVAAAAASASSAPAQAPTHPLSGSGRTSHSLSARSLYAYKGRPHTKRFDVELTFAGSAAGRLSGQITVMWKQKARK